MPNPGFSALVAGQVAACGDPMSVIHSVTGWYTTVRRGSAGEGRGPGCGMRFGPVGGVFLHTLSHVTFRDANGNSAPDPGEIPVNVDRFFFTCH
jgi:hypothetical protein